jgi:hypothetical protein
MNVILLRPCFCLYLFFNILTRIFQVSRQSVCSIMSLWKGTMKKIFTVCLMIAAILYDNGCKNDSKSRDGNISGPDGVIMGQVIGSLSGQKIKAVTISTLPATQATQTDSLGNFVFEKIPVGVYIVIGAKSAYGSDTTFAVVIENDTARIGLILNYVAPTTGLVAYYPFAGNAIDHSSFGNNGTVYGATLTTDRFGNMNSAYYFNGINSDIEVSHTASLNPTQGITYCAWVDFYDLTKVGAVMEKGRDVSVGYYSIRFAPGQNLCAGARFVEDAYPNPATGFAYTAVLPNQFQWYFVALTYNGQKMKYYINGEVHDSLSVSKTLGVTTEILAIGRHPFSGYDYWFNGKIDDVRIYNRALTADEMLILYNER